MPTTVPPCVHNTSGSPVDALAGSHSEPALSSLKSKVKRLGGVVEEGKNGVSCPKLNITNDGGISHFAHPGDVNAAKGGAFCTADIERVFNISRCDHRMDAYAKTGVYPMYDAWNVPYDRIDLYDPVTQLTNDF